MTFRHAHILLAALALSTGVALPASAQSLPGFAQRDRSTGAEGYKAIVNEFGGRVSGPLADYVRRIGLNVALKSVPGSRAEDWTITVLNSPVPNAMATPGGYLYITRGLLGMMNSEAELASVLGHEAGHVAARHSNKRQSRATIGALGSIAATLLGGSQVGELVNMGTGAWVSGFSRSQENEADQLGMRYSIAAGYDPRAAGSMLAALDRVSAVEGKEQMERQGMASIFSTHPVTAERVQRVTRAAAQTGRTGNTNRENFLAAVDEMPWGDSPDQGIVTGPSFRHAGLKLAFDAPVGFQLQNSPQAVAGKGRDGSQFIFSGGAMGNGQTLQDVVQTVWQQTVGQNSTPSVNYQERRINGIEAGVSEARLNSRQGTVDMGVYAYRTAPGQVYVIRTIAPAGKGAQFQSLVQSFRTLAANEIAAANRGRRIDIVTVKPGDTAASLSARMASPYNREASFLALNGITTNDVKPGARVKLIVG